MSQSGIMSIVFKRKQEFKSQFWHPIQILTKIVLIIIINGNSNEQLLKPDSAI